MRSILICFGLVLLLPTLVVGQPPRYEWTRFGGDDSKVYFALNSARRDAAGRITAWWKSEGPAFVEVALIEVDCKTRMERYLAADWYLGGDFEDETASMVKLGSLPSTAVHLELCDADMAQLIDRGPPILRVRPAPLRTRWQFMVAGRADSQFVDVESITKSAGVARAWIKNVKHGKDSISGKPIEYTVALASYRCAAKQIKIGTFNSYDVNGTAIYDTKGSESWTDLVPESVGEEAARLLCAAGPLRRWEPPIPRGPIP